MKFTSSKKWALAASAAFLGLALAPAAMAADHRDSGTVDALPEGDFSDVFAFVDPANQNNVVLMMAVNPFTNPSEAPSVRFGDDLLYQMKISNNADPAADLVLQIQFAPGSGAQTYSAILGAPNAGQGSTIGNRITSGTVVCPAGTPVFVGQVGPNVGGAGGVVTEAAATVSSAVPGGTATCFAGLRDDSFQTDVAQAVFRVGLNSNAAQNLNAHDQDLWRGYAGTRSLIGGLRGRPLRLDGTSGSDGFGGSDLTAIAVSVPKSLLRGTGITDVRTGAVNSSLIGVWGTVSRPTTETFDGFTAGEVGEEFAQFERMGQQLFNTVFVFQQPVLGSVAVGTAGTVASTGNAAYPSTGPTYPLLTGQGFTALCPTGPNVPGTTALTVATMKNLHNAVNPECDFALYSRFYPDSLTTTSSTPVPPSGGGLLGGLLGGISSALFGGGNTIAGRATLLTILGFNSVGITGTPLLVPQAGLQNNTNNRLNSQLSVPDYMRLNLDQATDGVRGGAATAGNSSPTLAIGQWGLQNGRRPADDVTDIVLRLNRELDDVKFTDNLVLPGIINAVPGAGPRGSRVALNCDALSLGGGQGIAGALATLGNGVLGILAALQNGGASDLLAGRYTIDVLRPCEDARIFIVLQGTDWIESSPLDVNNVANQVSKERALQATFPYLALNPVPGEAGTSEYPAQQ